MRFESAVIALLALTLTGCQTLFSNPAELTLEQANTNPAQYRDELVKVCGMATKQFENVQITEFRGENWRGKAAGLGVHWLEREPYTKGPEQRCITGYIEPTCGWLENLEYSGVEPYSREEYEDHICLSTGYSFEWRINQASLSRN